MKPFKFTVHLSFYISCAVFLLACSSGDGGTTSFTVSASAGANGSISPTSASVNQNDTTSFTVTPDTGYVIDTVSGCDGSLVGDTYTTGVITADCTVSASFIERMLGPVSALFPSAPNWNDYAAGRDWSTATDTACDADNNNACTHGGELRVVEATSRADCSGMTATDDLGAFNWLCDDSSGTARLISTGLADGKYLSDLIDFTAQGFRPNAVTVFENEVVWGTTPSSTWWTNPIETNNIGGSLISESTIYIVTSDTVAAWTLDANKLALVVQPGFTLTGPGTGNIVIDASNRDYLWLEGDIDASGDGIGVNLSTVRFSVLRKLTAKNAPLGVLLDQSNNNRLSDVTASNTIAFGITLQNGSNNNTLSGLKVHNNASGINLDNASNNTFSDLITSNSSSAGIGLTNISNSNTLSNVTVSNSQTGVLLDSASNNALSGVTANNNSDSGIKLDRSSTNNTFSSLAVRNNDRGINFNNASNSNVLSDLAAGDNDDGIVISNSDDNTFTGLLEVGSNDGFDCLVIGMTNNPGLDEPDCAASGASDHTLVSNISLADSFVGKLLSGDALNTSDVDGAAIFPADPATFDWSGFDNAYRGWGIDGSDLPDVDHQGQWTTGPGRIWDWSVSTGDTGNNGFAALLAVFVVPDGNDTLTHRWDGTPASNDDPGCDEMVAGSVWNSTDSVCETTFLRNAVEIQADGLGNDNTLCESGETCLYTPNIGSYQGHGELVSAGVITAGTLSGITLMKYDSNGR